VATKIHNKERNMMKISAKQKDGNEISVDFDFGNNLDEVVEKFGGDATFKAAIANLKVQVRGWLVAQHAAGQSPESIQASAAGWKPNQRKARATKLDKLRNFIASLPVDEQAAFLKEQMKRVAAAAKAA